MVKSVAKKQTSSTAAAAGVTAVATDNTVAGKSKSKTAKRAASTYAGIKTPVNNVYRIIKARIPKRNWGTKARVFLAAVLEGLARDLISTSIPLAGRTTEDKPRMIMAPHVYAALNAAAAAHYRLFPGRVGGIHTAAAAAGAAAGEEGAEEVSVADEEEASAIEEASE